MNSKPTLNELLRRPEAPVEEPALLIAADERPSLDVDGYLRLLDEMAQPIAQQLPSHATPDAEARLLADHVYGRLGFAGNSEDYYDPRNSYLDRVIDRRIGIPLTLAMVLMALGRRAGMTVQGVGFPGHFLARVGGEGGVLIDPFEQGRMLGDADLRELAVRFLGHPSQLRPELLEAVDARSMIVRMLTNLKQAHRRRGDQARMMVAADRLVDLTAAPEHRRDRGMCALTLGSHAVAAEDLEAYLEARPQARDVTSVREALEKARGQTQVN
jgi:regulator of sirC expression with transglutaminase-like and TPR domain